MPQSVIDRVHALAQKDNASGGLVFKNRNGQDFPTNEDDDDDLYDHTDAVSPFPDFPAQLPGIPLSDAPIPAIDPRLPFLLENGLDWPPTMLVFP
jgi:hypothetical protein